MFHGIEVEGFRDKRDSGFVLVMTLGILLALSVFFAGMAGLLRMKSKLVSYKTASFYASLESENEMIQREWLYETR